MTCNVKLFAFGLLFGCVLAGSMMLMQGLINTGGGYHLVSIYRLSALQGEFGFTCTGLAYDARTETFLIGDIGKLSPDGEEFCPKIIRCDKTFSKIVESYSLHQLYPDMKDVQGIAVDDTDGTIWCASPAENYIHHFSMSGVDLGGFAIEYPTGVAYDRMDDVIWVLTPRHLISCEKDGSIVEQFEIAIPAQDQISLDPESRQILITAGDDYQSENFLYVFDIENSQIVSSEALDRSFAIEGLVLLDQKLFVANDGFYHHAVEPFNQINVYEVS